MSLLGQVTGIARHALSELGGHPGGARTQNGEVRLGCAQEPPGGSSFKEGVGPLLGVGLTLPSLLQASTPPSLQVRLEGADLERDTQLGVPSTVLPQCDYH